jgi:hypothetical protein
MTNHDKFKKDIHRTSVAANHAIDNPSDENFNTLAQRVSDLERGVDAKYKKAESKLAHQEKALSNQFNQVDKISDVLFKTSSKPSDAAVDALVDETKDLVLNERIKKLTPIAHAGNKNTFLPPVKKDPYHQLLILQLAQLEVCQHDIQKAKTPQDLIKTGEKIQRTLFAEEKAFIERQAKKVPASNPQSTVVKNTHKPLIPTPSKEMHYILGNQRYPILGLEKNSPIEKTYQLVRKEMLSLAESLIKKGTSLIAKGVTQLSSLVIKGCSNLISATFHRIKTAVSSSKVTAEAPMLETEEKPKMKR